MAPGSDSTQDSQPHAHGTEGLVASYKAAGWQRGDPFTGDPPGELQGAFSVYDADTTTLEVLSKFGRQM